MANMIGFLFQYEFEASFLEIYNETIRDLLGNGKEEVKHDIKMVAANSTEVVVTNVTLTKVDKQEQVSSIQIYVLKCEIQNWHV